MNGPKLTDDELRRLGKTWFAEARAKSAKDEAEFTAWNTERLKWMPSGSDSGGFFGFGDSDSGGGDSGGGGGD